MQRLSFKDFFIKHKKSILISSSVILILTTLLLTLFLTDAFNGFTKRGISNPEKESSKNEYYSANIENDNPNCTLTKIEYPESAFSIGVPNGWLYEVDNGTVSIMEDDTNTTSVFLYTAKLEKDLTKEDFLKAFATIFKQTIEATNGTFEVENIKETEEDASADIYSKIDGYDIKGKMFVSKSGEFVTFKSYWAPVESYDEKQDLLEQVSRCFARTRVLTEDVLQAAKSKEARGGNTPAGFQVYKGKYFKLNKPSNFNVTGETDSGIDLTRSDGNAGFSYAYATGFTGSYTPKSWAQRALPEFGKIQNVKITDGAILPSQISGHNVQEFNFTGNLSGVSVTGKATVGVYQSPYFGIGTRYSSAFWAIQISTPENWESVKATLQEMQDSFTITDIGATRKNTLLPSNRPMESTRSSVTSKNSSYSSALSDESSENWAEGMRGYETVSSPSTGQTYDVPLNSWSSYGPEGAGYYRELPNNSLEKLQ
ncbi:MAG: hypothetical protein RBT33_02540 [Candidatus Dojkabacteria bacterium]|jgi:hypothetical protein|nr:hypothetical protein [Candidatus Dojkabacteria bacterium]